MFIIAMLAITTLATQTFADGTGGNAAKPVTLSGQVIDKTNQETLAGALIRIEGTDIETYTDFEGNFSISGILPDTYKIKCSMISYTEKEVEIEIDQKVKNLEIQLENYSAR